MAQADAPVFSTSPSCVSWPGRKSPGPWASCTAQKKHPEAHVVDCTGNRQRADDAVLSSGLAHGGNAASRCCASREALLQQDDRVQPGVALGAGTIPVPTPALHGAPASQPPRRGSEAGREPSDSQACFSSDWPVSTGTVVQGTRDGDGGGEGSHTGQTGKPRSETEPQGHVQQTSGTTGQMHQGSAEGSAWSRQGRSHGQKIATRAHRDQE